MAAPTIARVWRGRTRPEVADAYEAYNYEVGIKPLIEKALGVQTFRENREHESEFMTISYWEDIPAMARFTGRDPTDIHHLDRDPEFLIELPKSVQIIRLLTSQSNFICLVCNARLAISEQLARLIIVEPIIADSAFHHA